MARYERAASVPCLVIALLALPALAPPGKADDAEPVPPVPRVVVQDARPVYLEISADGRIIAGRGVEVWHTFYAIDAPARKTLLMLNLPQQITDVAVAPHNDWFAVSGERTVYRVDVATGSYDVLLENVTGAVALNSSGDRLAVLGVLGGENVDLHWPIRVAGAELGIYDLAQKKWLARGKTPILVDLDVWFEGDTACAFGRGGRVFNRRASSFRCDARLSPGGEKPKINRGREVFRGAREDDGYVPAVELAARTETHESARKLLQSMQEELSPDRLRGERVFLPLPGDGREARPVERGRQPYGGLLQVGRDGAVSMIPLDTSDNRGIYRMGGRLVKIPYDNDSATIAVEDLLSGKRLVSFPFQHRFEDISRSDYWMLPLSHGFLVHQPNTLAYYSPGKPKAVWEKPFARYARRPYPYGMSQDGKFLFFGGDEGPLATVFSAETGKAVLEIDREGRQTGYARSGSLNADGSRFAWLSFDGRVQVREVPSGKKVYDEQLPPKTYFYYVTAAGAYWVLGSETAGSRIINVKANKSVPFSLAITMWALPIEALGRACLLVETRKGKGGIVDVETGEVHAEWFVGERQSNIGVLEAPPRAAALFDGKLLVRRTGHASDFELIDLATLDVVATVYPMRVTGSVGWITATPDGYWDASPGAERYVELFAGQHNLVDEKASRRKPQVIRDRLARVIARSR